MPQEIDSQVGQRGNAGKVLFGAALTLIVVALGTCAYYWKSQQSVVAELPPAVVKATPTSLSEASLAAAPNTSLIQRLLPNSQIRNVEKIDFGANTFLWEVDMLAEKGRPDTAGFVYLSADGTKMLNGPLMDKRSRIGMVPPSELTPEQHAEQTQTQPEGASATPPAAEKDEQAQQAAFDPRPAIEAKQKEAAHQREVFFSAISELRYIPTTKGSHVVYALFDPLCHACIKLYQQSNAVAEAYDVEFRWIPIFLDAKSRPLSALLQKIYNADPAKGMETMGQMLTKTWKAEDHILEISQLSDADYAQIDVNAAVFLQVAKAVPGIGTPFVMFKNGENSIDAYGGVPLATDWASLRAPNSSPVTAKQ
jgi:hypothetical protein